MKTGTDESVETIVQEAMTPEATPEANQEGHIAEQSQPEQAEQAAPYTIKHKGKDIGLEDPAFKDYAQKGYDYEQKMHKFRVDSKLQQKEFESKTAAFKELEQINDYAKENPAFEQLIQREWARVQNGEQVQVAPEDRVQVLESRLNQVLEKVGNAERELETRREAELEATQEGAISAYKERHSGFDWVKKDDSGFTLEDKIGQAMIDKKLGDFNIMADSFLLQEHMDRNSLESKEAVGKSLQKSSKLGLGQVTKKSSLGVKSAEGVRGKTMDQLAREGLEELGIPYV